MHTVDLDNSGSADPGSSKVREMTSLHSENAGKALGKPRGFGRWDVGTISPQNELYVCVNCNSQNHGQTSQTIGAVPAILLSNIGFWPPTVIASLLVCH